MVRTAFSLVSGMMVWATFGAGAAVADADPDRWEGPFGGTFSASLTVVSDYSFAGISQTQRQPALQPSFGYRTAGVGQSVEVWGYVGLWGSNIDFPGTGPGLEIDVLAGMKLRALDRRLSADLGYIRYFYPGVPASLAYDYGDIVLSVGYDFKVFQINGRVRYSPNSFGASGTAWNKRALLQVPLPFLYVNEKISLKAYGTLGNQWVERYLNYGIPSSDYWYWQTGLIVSAYGVDVTLAYSDSSIDIAGCGNTMNCQGRVIVGLTKAF